MKKLQDIDDEVYVPNLSQEDLNQFLRDVKEDQRKEFSKKNFQNTLELYVSPRLFSFIGNVIFKIEEFNSQEEIDFDYHSPDLDQIVAKKFSLLDFFLGTSKRGYLIRGVAGIGKTTITKYKILFQLRSWKCTLQNSEFLNTIINPFYFSV